MSCLKGWEPFGWLIYAPDGSKDNLPPYDATKLMVCMVVATKILYITHGKYSDEHNKIQYYLAITPLSDTSRKSSYPETNYV